MGFLLLSQVSTVWQFYILYGVVMGIGLGTTVIPIMSTISRWFVGRRALMTGITQAGAGIGGIIMPLLAGRFILDYGWRNSCIILGVMALVSIIPATQFLKRDPAQIGLAPYGEGDEVKKGGLGLPGGGLSLQEAMHSRQFWMLMIIFFFFGFARNTILVHIAPYATDLGFSLLVGANILAIISGVSILGRLVFGRMADSIGSRPAIIVGFMLFAIGLFWVVVAKELWMLYLFAIIFGFSWGALAVSRFSLTSELFGLSSLGMILGIIEIGATVGGASSPLLSGWIFDMTGSYLSAFLVNAGAAVLGFVLCWLLKPIGGKGAKVDSNG